MAVTNASGAVLERYQYDAYGQSLVSDPAGAPRAATSIGNPWRFTGQEWLGEPGLHYYKNRFYHEELGRFLQNDPVRFDAGDLNLYRYCFNDPVNRGRPDSFVNVLNERERRVLTLIGSGWNDERVAAEVEFSVHSAHGYRTRIMRKLNLHSTPELMRYAVENGFTRYPTAEGLRRSLENRELGAAGVD